MKDPNKGTESSTLKFTILRLYSACVHACMVFYIYIYMCVCGKHDCVVGLVTILQAGQAHVSVPRGTRDFSPLQNAQTSFATSGCL
jgi:hypothetical protein